MLKKRKRPRPVKKKGLRLRRVKPQPQKIVIDPGAGLVFSSEEALYVYFQDKIDFLEEELQKILDDSNNEICLLNLKSDENEDQLLMTLDEPIEIWHDGTTFKEDFPIFHFIRPLEEENAFQVAVCYVSSEDEPTFVFLHFITQDLKLVDHYRKGTLIYDRAFEEVEFGALEGDSLGEGDPLAMGLFISMLKVRSEKDVPYDQFKNLGLELRNESIENSDEVWRTLDLNGNQIVTFIKEFPDHETIKDLYYIVLTYEDPTTNVNTLLFSFPTTDSNLVDRYRRGENLQTEDVVQESSH